MLSDASLVSGDSNAPAGGPAVVLRRHHHLRSVTSPQAPSLPLQVPDPPFPPQTPLQVAGGPAGTSRYFCSTPVVILDLLLFFSSGHLLIISFSPMFFPAQIFSQLVAFNRL